MSSATLRHPMWYNYGVLPCLTYRNQRKFQLLAAAAISALIYASSTVWPRNHTIWPGDCNEEISGQHDDALSNDDGLPCRKLPGANETLIVMRTGSTELEAKLSTHLQTTMRCFPHKLIFSDAAETYMGHSVVDALESVSPIIKDHHPDFELYRRLRHGRRILSTDELHGWSNEATRESWTGHTENPGWKLDKWKFLPMMKKTLQTYPEGINWYVFMEADSYVVWPTLLAYLGTLDHTQPYYSGVEVYISDVPFAHGGSCFIVSPAAMQLVVGYYDTLQDEVESWTDGHWAGDCVLGKYFAEARVSLTGAWPIFQGDDPGIVAYLAPDGRPRPPVDANIWCSPAVSYHHMESPAVRELWQFEQQEMLRQATIGPRVMTHGDVFDRYVLPRIKRDNRDNWDNLSGEGGGIDVGSTQSVDVCQAWCEADTGCVQYSLDHEHCYNFHLPRLGKPKFGVQSGWLVERIKQLRAAVQDC